ncbi:MAG: two-component regulator propeller domain-containing protein, partial [Thermoanaerobaculia bacterium]
MIDREVRAVLLAVAMLLLPGSSLFAIDAILTGEHLQLSFEGWDASHGLPQSSVQKVVQTDDGYLWIGTMGGLARFDGARFRVFDRKTTPELGDSLVQALLADGDLLWIGTGSGGALVYDGETFRRIEGLPSDMVWDFTRGGDGRIWVATQAGLAVIGQAGAKRVSIPGIPMDAPFFALATDAHGAVWGGTEQGVLFQIDTHEVTTWGRDDGLPVAAIRTIREDGAGAMWIGTESGLIRYNGVSFERFTTRDGLASNVVRAIIPDYEGDLWVGTYGGLSRRRGERFDSYDRSELSSETIRSLLADREGNLWIGTGGGGLLRARPALVRSLPSSEAIGFARSVLETRSASVWVGTFGDGALEIRDGETRRLTMADGLPDDVVYSLAEDDEGRIWLGTRNGVARWNGSRFDRVLADPETFASRVARALFIDADGALWIGTLRGIYRWDESGIREFGRTEGMAGDAVFNFAQSRDGTLWAASYGGGLHRLEGARFVPVPSGPDVPTSRVWSITIDDDGTLWMGSRGAGLVRYRDGEFFAFDTRAGLFDDVVYQVIEDGQGRLWMSGNKGIFAVLKSELEEFSAGNRSQITTLTLGKAEGMRSPECNGATQPAGWRTHNGLILFPTLDGIAVVDPDSARRSVSDPKVIVEALLVNGKAIAMDE